MPKRFPPRSNARAPHPKDQEYDEDSRRKEKNMNAKRRVSFKPSQLGGNYKRRMAELALRGNEDDEDMGDMGSSSRYGTHGTRRKGSPIPKGNFGSFRKLVQSPFDWYQVTVQFAQRYGKDQVVGALLGAIRPDTFIPHYWFVERKSVIFFIHDINTARSLMQKAHDIVMSDGNRIYTTVRTAYPIVPIDESLKQRMKIAMAKRYNSQTRALDLTRFHEDPDFKDVFCGLVRTPIMNAAFEIMEDHIPELQALNLNDNQIASLGSFKDLERRLPNLKILYLEENKIYSLSLLSILRNVPIVELGLKSNPFARRYNDRALYISDVRRKFPNVVKLDGENLEPIIKFDVHDSQSLPEAKASFLCDVSGTEIVRQFVEQYFNIFDSDNRQPLLDAYHANAMMSVTCPPASQVGRLQSFWRFNRNWKRNSLPDEVNRKRLLKYGRLQVVSTLSEFPKTKHDIKTFSVDLTVFTPQFMAFTVAGLFKELDAPSSSNGSNYADIRYFQRHFIIVPAGGGFCIRNEVIFITNATHVQARTFENPAFGLGNSESINNRMKNNQEQPTPAVQMPMPASQPVVVDDATKIQMIQTLNVRSNMNLEWSQKCLEETNWDYNRAICAFDKLHAENKIPPEAFVK